MLKTILKDSSNNFKQHILPSVLLTFLPILIIFGLSFIIKFSLVGYLLIILPFIILPILYATQVSHYGFRQDVNVSFKSFMRYYGLYFSNKYRGSYRFIYSLVISLVGAAFAAFLMSYVAQGICGRMFPNFSEAYKTLYDAISHGSNIELENAFLAYPAEINAYIDLIIIPSATVFALVMVLLVSYNSLYLYFRIKNPKLNPQYARSIFRFAKSQIRGKLIGSYWALNFPLFILLLAGIITGYFVSLNFNINYVDRGVIAFASGLLFSGLYYPMVLSNLESTFAYFQNTFNEAPKSVADKMLKNLQDRMNEMQKYRDQLNSKLKDEDNQGDDS